MVPPPSDVPLEIQALRARMDAIDAALVGHITERYALVGEMFRAKARLGVAPIDPAREAEILDRVEREGAARGLPEGLCRAVWEALLSASHAAADARA